MLQRMKEKFIKDLPMLVGMVIGLSLIDLFSGDKFQPGLFVIRVMAVLVVHIVFSYVELKRKKK